MLTDLQVQQAKATHKHRKLWDQGGLHLYVSPKGGKSWRYDYVLSGMRQTVTLGTYPEFSLTEARERHAEARKLVARGISPAKEKALNKQAAREAARAAREAQAREKAGATEGAFNRDIAAFSGKPLGKLTAGEALAGLSWIADEIIAKFFERSSARAPEEEER